MIYTTKNKSSSGVFGLLETINPMVMCVEAETPDT